MAEQSLGPQVLCYIADRTRSLMSQRGTAQQSRCPGHRSNHMDTHWGSLGASEHTPLNNNPPRHRPYPQTVAELVVTLCAALHIWGTQEGQHINYSD